MYYNNAPYYFQKNLQRDVVRIINSSGNIVVEYTYDAWGKVLSVTGSLANTLGQRNPFRYRSYYYDTETGFYYLQSRYYDPTVGRFLNADHPELVGANGGVQGYNLFAYCNNPIMGYDPLGEWDWGSFFSGSTWLAIGLTAVCVGVSVLTCGVATPLMVAVASVTASAGTLTMVNGASEIGEAATGHNVIRDDIFQGSEAEYAQYANTMSNIALAGTAICGGFIADNPAPKSEKIGTAFKSGQRVGHSQIGVDPNTLTTTMTIHPEKYAAAKAKILQDGMYGVIEVYSDGRVYNGNHRVIIARELGICVDTIVHMLS